MTPSAEPGSRRPGRRAGRLSLIALLAVVLALLLGLPASGQTPSPGAGGAAPSPAVGASLAPSATTAPCPNPTIAPTPTPEPTREGAAPAPTEVPKPTPRPNLCPAVPGSDPVSTIAWLFTPLFQAIFMLLVIVYDVVGAIERALGSTAVAPGDIGITIIIVTLIIRALLIPIFRRQIVSSRRMVALQPEMRAIQAKYKGDRAKVAQEQQRLYKERGVSPASGCLPALLTLFLLGPMYYVFTSGLQAPDISSMLTVLNFQIPVTCQPEAATGYASCLNPYIPWLGFLSSDPRGLNASVPEILFTTPIIAFGVSLLALIAAFLQLIQTRMSQMPTSDPQMRVQNRTMLILPAISLIYGAFLPAGLFIYWIAATIFAIVQQYLIAGWGALFPLFGWHPAFARNHQPRYPVAPAPAPNTLAGGVTAPTRRTATDSAAGTVKPSRQRARTSRRGRRR